VRLNCVDHYQAIPTPYDPQLRRDVRASQRQNEPRVPVIRVFGSTETGQKVCAHIHGAFPYLYIEYTGSLFPDEGEPSTSYELSFQAYFLSQLEHIFTSFIFQLIMLSRSATGETPMMEITIMSQGLLSSKESPSMAFTLAIDISSRYIC